MPTATTILGWTLANWGPAPATYTGSAACTRSSSVWIADNDVPEAPLWAEACSTSSDDSACWPQPTDPALYEEAVTNAHNVPYWSPGVDCPSGFSSVGAVERPGDGPGTSSGIFTQTNTRIPPDDRDSPIVFGAADALGALLDPSETAIACCPSSMSVGRNGICYAILSSHSISTACQVDYADVDPDVVSTTVVIHGTTHTGGVIVPTEITRPTVVSTATTTFDSDEVSELVALTMFRAIYLVHHPSDADGASETGDSDSSSETNAAARLYSGQNTYWSQIKAVVGALAVSVMAGMALVLPW